MNRDLGVDMDVGSRGGVHNESPVLLHSGDGQGYHPRGKKGSRREKWDGSLLDR